MTIYRISALHLKEYVATKALAAQMLGVTVAQLDARAAQNVAAGRDPYPVVAEVPVTFGGRLANFRTKTTTQVTLDEIDVLETL